MAPSADTLLAIDPAEYKAAFDRTPVALQHGLHQLPMFQPDALAALALKYADKAYDYYVANSAATPGTKFFDAGEGKFRPHEALEHLDKAALRILLKRPENSDDGFRDLLHALFDKVIALRGGLNGEKVVRLESAVFISSAASTTPFHFDPEINHFFQIAGEKSYHVYAPAAVTDRELEDFYIQGIVEIGQVDLAGRDQGHEHVYDLVPGSGFHQPQNAPHWVRTGAGRSVSYCFVYETDASRARGRTIAANHYLRKLGMKPRHPGESPGSDQAKASLMRAVIPVRRRIVRTLRNTLGR